MRKDSTGDWHLEWQPGRRLEGLLALITAVVWLVWSHDANALGLSIAIIAALWLIGAGLPLCLWPGDRHITQQMAIAALGSFVLALVLGFASGPPLGVLLLLALSVVVFPAAGYAAIAQEPRYDGAPDPDRGVSVAAKAAVDEALLGYFTLLVSSPLAKRAQLALREVEQAETLWADQGWLDDPASFHQTPTEPVGVDIQPKPIGRWKVELLSMHSGYSPSSEVPGTQRWQQHESNRTLYARLLRHPGPPRPWLICIHGYRMGTGLADLSMFSVKWLHERLGLNLMLPVLPLHGPRRCGWLSGDGFLDGDPMETVHAEAQAAWDIRRQLLWIRGEQAAPAVGVIGYSLGGYNAALLSALEPELACVIAGIPASDLAALLWRHSAGPPLAYLESLGLTRERLQRLFGVISPLHLPCAVEQPRRFMFGATADRLVTPGQVLELWRHWDEPEIYWYQGGHLTFRADRGVGRLIEQGLRAGGLIDN